MPHPMVFELSTIRSKLSVYVGVLEFLAPPDSCVLPFWLFEKLKLKEGEMVKLHLITSLPKSNFCKIRPHKTEFIQLEDPKHTLEICFNNFVCLKVGQTITIKFNDKQYDLDIVELKPESPSNGGIIIDTDLTIDFEPPLDYVEPPKPDPKELAALENLEDTYDPRKHKIKNGIRKDFVTFKNFQGKGIVLGG